MTARTLSIINAIGCLVLTGVIVLQWRKERAMDGTLSVLQSELSAARSEAADEAERGAALERDIAVLKESIESTQQAAEALAHELGEKDALVTRVQADLDAARAQITSWEAAIRIRDERIQSLDADLAAARKRLDEAIAKLKEASSR